MATGFVRTGLPRAPVQDTASPDLLLLFRNLHFHGSLSADPADAREGEIWLRTDLDPVELRGVLSGQVTTLLTAEAGTGPQVDWTTVHSTPTTYSGYGITDAASDADLSAHIADTTGVHGIADTAALALTGDPPTAHAASHAAAGSDPLTLEDLAGDLPGSRISGAVAEATNAGTLDLHDTPYFLDRTNHTGQQVAATVSDLPEAVQDLVGAMIAGGGGVTATYDDGAGTITLGLTAEVIQDIIGALVTGTANQITATYDDAANTFVLSLHSNVPLKNTANVFTAAQTISGGTVVGAVTLQSVQANASGAVINTLAQNSNNAATAAHARTNVQSGGAAGGDPIYALTVPGVLNWHLGIDNSVTGDPLSLGDSDTPGTNTNLLLTTAGNMALGDNVGTGVNFQGMVGGLYLKSGTAPAGNPSGGGFLFVDAVDGGLKYRGPSGTITTLGAA